MVTHLPLIHVADCEPHGTLVGHFARANPHAEAAAGDESIAIFHGPHAYVSPSWYAEPAAAVPTWNYAVVHAHGRIVLARSPAETQALLDLMIHRFESARPAPCNSAWIAAGWRRWSGRSSAFACGSGASTPSSSCRRTGVARTACASRPRSTPSRTPTPRRRPAWMRAGMGPDADGKS